MAHENARHGPTGSRRTPGSRYAGVRELNEMTIGRTDDPENPPCVTAFKRSLSCLGLDRGPHLLGWTARRHQMCHLRVDEQP
jgi:hypothetical protein